MKPRTVVTTQAMLAERNVKCVGCMEKSEFRERVLETIDMPIVRAGFLDEPIQEKPFKNKYSNLKKGEVPNDMNPQVWTYTTQ